ncbi:MAG: hypothetical protein QM655_01600 [Nocardioidaceae bacterium]
MSAAIFVALALGWAIYLIPKALKRHDDDARTRSIDTFSSKMRVLARREPVDSRSARLITTQAPATTPAPPDTRRPPRPEPPVRSQARAAARSAARRRRRILIVLLLADIVVGALSATAVLLPWAAAIPVGITVLYLVLCRVLVRRERRRRGTRVRPQAAEHPEAEVRRSEEPAPLRNEQGFEQVTASEDTTAIDVSALGGQNLDGASLWDPLPVTLPTYVGKATAPRTVRTIDLDDPTVANSGRDAADSQLVAEAESAAAETAGEPSSAQHAV